MMHSFGLAKIECSTCIVEHGLAEAHPSWPSVIDYLQERITVQGRARSERMMP